MKPETMTGKRSVVQTVCGGVVAAIALFSAQAAAAETAYGCQALETHAALPAVEADGGVFFAIRPELQAFHAAGDDAIPHLADLSAALSARGTTLVLLPVPTRAQVMSHQLPAMAGHLGYDAAASLAVYEDMMARLNRAQLTVADPMRALRRAASAQERPFFETDPRPTTRGTQLLAAAVGEALADHPDLSDLTRRAFTSTPGEMATLSSNMRLQLQRACQSQLPEVSTQTYLTTPDEEANTSSVRDKLVVLGTSITKTTELNMLGFLSEATGIETLSYGVDKGGAFAAMSSYLTSDDFQEEPPRVLVWEWPVTASLSNKGTQPLRELVAAASNACGVSLTLGTGSQEDRLRADLGKMQTGGNAVLSFDAGGIGLPFVRFHFKGEDGLTRSRSIYRHKDQLLTGRFYLPLSDLRTQDMQEVEIETPVATGAAPRLSLCL